MYRTCVAQVDARRSSRSPSHASSRTESVIGGHRVVIVPSHGWAIAEFGRRHQHDQLTALDAGQPALAHLHAGAREVAQAPGDRGVVADQQHVAESGCKPLGVEPAPASAGSSVDLETERRAGELRRLHAAALGARQAGVDVDAEPLRARSRRSPPGARPRSVSGRDSSGRPSAASAWRSNQSTARSLRGAVPEPTRFLSPPGSQPMTSGRWKIRSNASSSP